jgi:hypothetical protein
MLHLLVSKSAGQLSVSSPGANAARSIVALQSDGGMAVMEDCTSQMRLLTRVNCCRSRGCRAKQVRTDCNTKDRTRRFGNHFPDRVLGHRRSINPKPKRIRLCSATTEDRPIDFEGTCPRLLQFHPLWAARRPVFPWFRRP